MIPYLLCSSMMLAKNSHIFCRILLSEVLFLQMLNSCQLANLDGGLIWMH